MSNEEIQKMLSGNRCLPTSEVPAVIFAQHYAETRGNPTLESWQRIVKIYGSYKAKGILGSVRAIMIGNAYGIAWNSFFNR